jgi:hypothetical protein
MSKSFTITLGLEKGQELIHTSARKERKHFKMHKLIPVPKESKGE